jgi:hypothetical protein
MQARLGPREREDVASSSAASLKLTLACLSSVLLYGCKPRVSIKLGTARCLLDLDLLANRITRNGQRRPGLKRQA